jgi:exodeoxyribonuclease V gamma subunit
MAGLSYLRAADAAVLAGALAERWATPPDDPFATDLLCVPARGTGRWLAQALSRRLGARAGDDGVTAAVTPLTLTQLVADVTAVAEPAADAWRGEALVQAILAVLGASAAEPWFATLAAYLQRPSLRPGRKVQLARRLARRVQRYLTWSPDLVQALLVPGPFPDWIRDPDPAHWQAGLLRALADLIGQPPAAYEAELLAQLRATDPLPGAARVAVFCPDAVPPFAAAVLAAVAEHHDVTLWARAVPGLDAGPSPIGRGLGRAAARVDAAFAALAPPEDLASPAAPPTTALAAVQAALLGPAPSPDIIRGTSPGAGDGSLEFHASHSADRQTDVLRDLILAALADDPALEPRDILVVCPQLAQFQGWFDAAFRPPADDLPWAHPAHQLRVHVAGAYSVPFNPVLDALTAVVDLAQSRATAGQLLGLAANPAVMARFGWSDDDRDRIAELVRAAGIRWGITAERRRAFGLDAFSENTWQAGLQRLALGVAADPSQLTPVGTALPLAEVTPDQAALVGGLLELTGRVRHIVAGAEPAPGPVWAARLRDAVDLLAGTAPDDAWQRTETLGLIARLDTGGPAAPDLDVADVAAWLAAARADRQGRDSFLTGGLTICGVHDLPHVPHEVIIWAGLDDASFPRREDADGDDLLAPAADVLGLPTATLADRQAFTASLLDARRRFLVVYRGHDARNNAEIMPPAPVRDLLGLAAQVLGEPDPKRLITHHPAHPFSLSAARRRAGTLTIAILIHSSPRRPLMPACIYGRCPALSREAPSISRLS